MAPVPGTCSDGRGARHEACLVALPLSRGGGTSGAHQPACCGCRGPYPPSLPPTWQRDFCWVRVVLDLLPWLLRLLRQLLRQLLWQLLWQRLDGGGGLCGGRHSELARRVREVCGPALRACSIMGGGQGGRELVVQLVLMC